MRTPSILCWAAETLKYLWPHGVCIREYNFNSLRSRLNRRPFADDIFKCIFLNENEWILPRISLKFVPRVRINNIPALVQIVAWCRPDDKPLSELMMVSLLTHICVTRPQWVKVHPWLKLFITLPIRHFIQNVAMCQWSNGVDPFHERLGISKIWISYWVTIARI